MKKLIITAIISIAFIGCQRVVEPTTPVFVRDTVIVIHKDTIIIQNDPTFADCNGQTAYLISYAFRHPNGSFGVGSMMLVRKEMPSQKQMCKIIDKANRKKGEVYTEYIVLSVSQMVAHDHNHFLGLKDIPCNK